MTINCGPTSSLLLQTPSNVDARAVAVVAVGDVRACSSSFARRRVVPRRVPCPSSPASPASRLRLKETFHVAAPPVEAVSAPVARAENRTEEASPKSAVSADEAGREETTDKAETERRLLATSLGRSCAC